MKCLSMIRSIYLLLTLICRVVIDAADEYPKGKFVVIPMDNTDPYFLDVKKGCDDKAAELSVSCVFEGPDETESINQTSIVDKHIDAGDVLGIAIAVIDEEVQTLNPAIERAVEKGIHVVTFDNDSPSSKREAFIGSDNERFGDLLGDILLQIKPEPGTRNKYGIVALKQTNIEKRVEGIEKRLDSKGAWRSKWEFADDSPKYLEQQSHNTTDLGMESLAHMRTLIKEHDVKAILSCCGWPMYNKAEWLKFRKEHEDIKLIIGDSSQKQIELFNQGSSDGLVGQLPYMMGSLAIEILFDKSSSRLKSEKDYRTGLLEYISAPLVLSEYRIEINHIKRLKWMGYALFGIIVILSVGFAIWVIVNIKSQVVMASQPLFLLPLCVGTLIYGSAIIPMSIEDNDYGPILHTQSFPKSCMSIQWLNYTGFTIIFSMLFSKTWRINQIFQNSQQLKRIVIKEKDVILPFTILFIANVAVLTCWTIIAPLKYVRNDLSGTDEWNRVIATAGYCASDPESAVASVVFHIILAFINIVTLIIACLQAFQARSIEIEYSEGKWILFAVLIILQANLIGLPVAEMKRKDPPLHFFVSSMIIFTTCAATLGCIFVPKIIYKRKKDSKTGRKFQNINIKRKTEDIVLTAD